jgi:hypothetical protein
MNSRDFPEEKTFILAQTVESDSAISSHHSNFSIIIGEFKLSEQVVSLDLISNDEGIRVIDIDIVAIFSHNGKS